MKKFIYDEEILADKNRRAISILEELSEELNDINRILDNIDDEVCRHSKIDNLYSYEETRSSVRNILENIHCGGDWYITYVGLASLAYDYYSEVEYKFQDRLEDIITGILRNSVDKKLETNNSIGATYELKGNNGDTSSVERDTVGFNDLLKYGCISKAVKFQFDQENQKIKESNPKGSEIDSVDEYIKSLAKEGKIEYKTYMEQVGASMESLIADMLPGVGDIKAFQEAVLGKNLITGEKLSSIDRGVSLASILPIAGDLGKGLKDLDRMEDVGKLSKLSELGRVEKLDEVLEVEKLKNIENVDELKNSDDIIKWESNTSLTAKDIPTAKSGGFNDFFNSLNSDELDELWKDKSIRKKIERELRAPGGLHEWHLVSRAPQFKRWGISAEQIKDLRSVISDVRFKNPIGQHGGLGSTIAHNELLNIIDSSQDYNTFIRRLNNWANYRLEGGINSLPEGLMLKRD